MNKEIIYSMIVSIGVQLAMAVIVMLFWNYAMPSVFGLSTINYLQALVLTLLSNIFFKHHENIKT